MPASDQTLCIAELMETSGVKFGTSGARGLAADMTDAVCYAYTQAFLQHLTRQGAVAAGSALAVAGDYRPSSGRIANACAWAARDLGFAPVYCGRLPTPAVANFGLRRGIPSLMITGSHIPEDRNGIKFYKPAGEILKPDEEGIRAQRVGLPAGAFDAAGALLNPEPGLPAEDPSAYRGYVRRFLDFLPAGCLAGLRVGLYEHSSVARDVAYEVMTGLGARVTRLARSERFVPVDTEAIRPEDVRLGRDWGQSGDFDCLFSTDGDGDRPLVGDEQGNWLRGDLAGVLCARYLGADAVVTPVSSNTLVEKCGWFRRVLRTRIGSPYVIARMQLAREAGYRRVMGYEANGGFLLASDLERDGRRLLNLPTRDALIVGLALLLLARDLGRPLSGLLDGLPASFTASGRLKAFPGELSRVRLAVLDSGDPAADRTAAEALFGGRFGPVADIDHTDGVRITFASGEIAHLRPSGNAPELRAYNEADSQARAEMNRICLEILEGWRA